MLKIFKTKSTFLRGYGIWNCCSLNIHRWWVFVLVVLITMYWWLLCYHALIILLLHTIELSMRFQLGSPIPEKKRALPWSKKVWWGATVWWWSCATIGACAIIVTLALHKLDLNIQCSTMAVCAHITYHSSSMKWLKLEFCLKKTMFMLRKVSIII